MIGQPVIRAARFDARGIHRLRVRCRDGQQGARRDSDGHSQSFGVSSHGSVSLSLVENLRGPEG